MSLFKPAQRTQAKLKIALTGPSGKGKTHSSLLIASGLGTRIAVADTENGSSSLEIGKKGIPPFSTLRIDPPYTVEKYEEAIKGAVADGFDVLILDSISHLWAGEGGLLQEKTTLDLKGGNQFTNWKGITAKHEHFIASILQSNVHIIATMRSKTEYVVGDDKKPRKVGLAPIQREGLEFEFTLVLDLGDDHLVSVSKDRTELFDGKTFKPTKETGMALKAWLEGGSKVPPVSEPPSPTPRDATPEPGAPFTHKVLDAVASRPGEQALFGKLLDQIEAAQHGEALAVVGKGIAGAKTLLSEAALAELRGSYAKREATLKAAR